MILSILSIVNSFNTFTQVDNTYLSYLSLISTITSTLILLVYSYLGAYLFNLSIPNLQLPWAETSSQPYLLQTLYKVMLVLTFKLRQLSHDLGLLYSLALVTSIVFAYRLYQVMMRSHMFDDTVYRV